ncbi:MAG: sulfatase-like hydrolase/transferase [Candidatus Hydrogenedentes bacterium]|nr:sulfatase-like hydrolase/transferase [Candidatus Hydrogenedentota bacterium]
MLADDLRADGFSGLGSPVGKTPNFDAIIERGCIFRKAYTMGSMIGAVCMPSRTMLLTGRSLFRAKNEASTEDPATHTLPRAMREAGYATLHAGKFGNSPKKVTEEFDTSVDPGHSEGVANAVIDFIRTRPADKPMFIYMAGPEPHDPQFAPEEFYAQYKPEDIPLPAAFAPYHPFDNGWMTGRDEMTLPFPRTPENIRGKLARYYASIAYLDAQFGRVVQALKDAGEYDNTLFVIAADNGLSLGEHGLLGKQNVYEFGGMHVPLVFAGPGISKGETNALAYLMDLFPTVFGLTGTPLQSRVEGRDLSPVIRGEAKGVRDWLYTAYEKGQRAITDGRWKLIKFPHIDKTVLFDLQADPHEEHDLAQAPEHADRVRVMMSKLAELQRDLDDPVPLTAEVIQPAEWSPDRLTPEQIQYQKEETARCASNEAFEASRKK